MFRLFKAELKKIFLKPSIFVVTGLLIFMLAASTFMYKPATRNNDIVSYSGESGQTVSWYYSKFTNGGSSQSEQSKTYFDSELVSVEENVINFYESPNNSVEKINNAWLAVKQKYASVTTEDNLSAYNFMGAYSLWSSQKGTSSEEAAFNNLVTVAESYLTTLKQFKTTYHDAINTEIPTILSTTDVTSFIDMYVTQINGYFSNNDDDKYGYILKHINNLNSKISIDNQLSTIMAFEPTTELIASLDDNYVKEAKKRCNSGDNDLIDQMDAYVSGQGVSSSTDLSTIKSLVTQYKNTIENACNIIRYSVKVSAMQKYTAIDITKYSGFEKYNYYEYKEKLSKMQYLFSTNTYDYEYADPFSIVQPSNQEPNAYDFSYYALRFCSFFIIVYIVVLAAGTIAGEQSAGTLKLLAIRPYSRRKLLTAKILSILAIAGILLFVSSVASLVVGGVYFGLSSAPILATFNATTTFVISPVLLYLIAFLTMFIEISFYALLSVFISTVFKSSTGSISVSTLIFFVSLILNVVATNVPALSFIPFTNVSWFKYFGSAFLSNANGYAFDQSVLTPTVFAGSSFWFSFGITTVCTAIIVYVTYLLFKRRDIK